MIGILICLIIIALKPGPSLDEVPAPAPAFPSSLDIYHGDTVVQLAENRIAIVDTGMKSARHGDVFVLEFNEDEKTFDLIGKYNYADIFRNPPNY